jgi:prefoldin alpha subunit
VLVPLTNSLYVKGRLADPDHVLVDVGTGFYVEKVTCPSMHHHRRRRHRQPPQKQEKRLLY